MRHLIILTEAPKVSPSVMAVLQQLAAGAEVLRGTDYPKAYWINGPGMPKVNARVIEKAYDLGLVAHVPYTEQRFVDGKVALTDAGRALVAASPKAPASSADAPPRV